MRPVVPVPSLRTVATRELRPNEETTLVHCGPALTLRNCCPSPEPQGLVPGYFLPVLLVYSSPLNEALLLQHGLWLSFPRRKRRLGLSHLELPPVHVLLAQARPFSCWPAERSLLPQSDS